MAAYKQTYDNPTEKEPRDRSRPSVLLPPAELRSGIPAAGIANTTTPRTISRPIQPTESVANKPARRLKLKNKRKSGQDDARSTTVLQAQRERQADRQTVHSSSSGPMEQAPREIGTPLAPFSVEPSQTTLRLHDEQNGATGEVRESRLAADEMAIPLRAVIDLSDQDPAAEGYDQTATLRIAELADRAKTAETVEPISPSPLGSQLARVVDAWPHLSIEIRTAVLVMVENARRCA